MLAFIMEDAPTRNMLEDFAVDYAKAQSSAELVNIAGFAAFDIILAAVLATVLAATTGGAGNTQE